MPVTALRRSSAWDSFVAVRLGYDAPLLAAITGRLARAAMKDNLRPQRSWGSR